MNRTPTLREVCAAHVDAALETLRVAMPGKVERYDPITMRAEVTPLLKVPVHRDDGSIDSVALPKLVEVPVVMPAAGGRYVKLPVIAGDVVLLVFCDYLLDPWKAKGGVVDPKGIGEHGLSGAIAIAGLRNPGGAALTAAIEIKADGTVLLGSNALQGVGLGSAIASALASLATHATTHTHPVTGALAGASASPPPTIGTVESSSVKTTG